MKNTKKTKEKIAGQLVAVLGRLVDIGKDLNTITSSLLDTLNNAIACGDGRDLDFGAEILKWTSGLSNIGTDLSGSTDDLMCAIEEVLSHG